jgi:hypothetical protein
VEGGFLQVGSPQPGTRRWLPGVPPAGHLSCSADVGSHWTPRHATPYYATRLTVTQAISRKDDVWKLCRNGSAAEPGQISAACEDEQMDQLPPSHPPAQFSPAMHVPTPRGLAAETALNSLWLADADIKRQPEWAKSPPEPATRACCCLASAPSAAGFQFQFVMRVATCRLRASDPSAFLCRKAHPTASKSPQQPTWRSFVCLSPSDLRPYPQIV